MQFTFFVLLSSLAVAYTLVQHDTYTVADVQAQHNLDDEGDLEACDSYVDLTEANRLESYAVGKKSECDDQISEHHEWFRFVGDAGTQMPESCVDSGYCGTNYPGWLRGKHPAQNGEIVIRNICFNKDGKCCDFSVVARVKLCGEVENGFYVYKLRSIPQASGENRCNRRYCGTKVASPCDSYEVLRENDRNDAYNKKGKKSDINLRPNTWFRFMESAGTMMPNSCVPEGYCGTGAPGWLQLKTHPSQNKGVVHATVCYHVDGECCKCKNHIAIKNCGEFYIYKLMKPLKCMGTKPRYCGTQKQVDPCESPTILTDADRLDSFDGHTKRSDSGIEQNTWYRLSGNAGYKIPEWCVPEKHCGTRAPGWLQGTHPQKRGHMVLRKICYHYDYHCCKFSNEVPVINCGSYYVYKLMRTPKQKQKKLKKLKMRYCGIQMPDKSEECNNYKTLSEADRAQSFSNGGAKKCDKKINRRSKWYRFDGQAGTRLATSPVDKGHCGTKYPGWMKGVLPEVSMGIVERQVCFRKGRKACQWTNDILVRNCGNFYVYHLTEAPKCSRYCGAPSSENKWSEPKGCYKDRSIRALPILYHNQRGSINWIEFPYNSKDIIEQCAVKARDAAFPCFGIQFWGECWGHKDGCEKYDIHGKSRRCDHGLGKHWTNYAYTAKCGSIHGCCDDNRTPKRNAGDGDCPECHSAVDLMFVVDSSDSINPANFDLIKKKFIINIVKHFTIHKSATNVAIIQYADTTEVVLPFEASRHRTWQGIGRAAGGMKRLLARGITHTGAALKEAYDLINATGRPGYPKRVVVLTNANTNDPEVLDRYAHELKKLKDTRVAVVGVFIEPQQNDMDQAVMAELQLIASSPEDVFYEHSFEDMIDDLQPLKKILCPD